MPTSFAITISPHRGGMSLQLRGTCCQVAEMEQFIQVIEQALQQQVRTLWIDCAHLQQLDRMGQQAILQVERLAAAARVVTYWYGFSSLIIQQLSETGLHLLLRSLPASSYRPTSDK